MALENKLGVELQTGVTESGVAGVHEQSSTNSKVGELKVFKNKDGTDISVYVTDKHGEYSFEALIEQDAPNHEYGEVVDNIGGLGKGVITQWDVVEKNDDAKLVRGKIRTFPDIES